ncbi:carboxypeptidase M32 [Clostridium saccharoperbutylacetonicum]|uniref:carboxypeptidase M32 n=1 Tax=Clostridium saccharoperbutylacetonicum TaxID=36745 RepID=UPI000983C0CB|nr:carboxypeptidase M32 [Clostridium saccharoperbutylacetonicum]AQR98009.1 carboxypeptidase 1 [Clostridium saccharoperbutylacetonicum]NSB33902.1 carboxypeptidase Taq [Clostridium saccharoperbutylacetonicum]
MREEIIEKLNEVKAHITKIEELNKLSALAYWDMKISMPQKALEQRSNTLGYLAGEIFKLSTGKEVKGFLDYFMPKLDQLSQTNRSMIKELKKEYDETKKIPEKTYKEYTIAKSLSEAAWEEAKEKNDFKIFEPHLEKMINFNVEFAKYYGYKENVYDALLNRYEEGMTVKKLDEIFGELKEGILVLLKYIEASNKKINRDFLHDKFKIKKQKKLSKYLLELIKFDGEAGILGETTHPFTLDLGNKDVRITTHYHEDDLLSNIFSVIHEGGHGLYEQHISDELIGTGLEHGASMGIHESQSRFYENIVGRSEEFLKIILPYIKKEFSSFKKVKLKEFYEAVNYVKPSLIRTEADELTYSLHIIIRYEIEKKLINREIEVKDLPRIWNEKYMEYLGVEAKSDSEGILQDMHWSAGDFGYFPSYALGNIYAGQFLNQILKDNELAITELENGDLSYIDNWLKDKIHKYGARYTPEELIKNVTGEDISTKYFLRYLDDKYKKIYTPL